MIKEFVQTFMDNQDKLKAIYETKHPEDYNEIVKNVISLINPENDYGLPDPSKITEIDHGDYQGTLLYVIAGVGYQPSDFWTVKVYYGSCSGCDTLQAIHECNWDETPNEHQVKDYMTLSLHVIQQLREVGGDGV